MDCSLRLAKAHFKIKLKHKHKLDLCIEVCEAVVVESRIDKAKDSTMRWKDVLVFFYKVKLCCFLKVI